MAAAALGPAAEQRILRERDPQLLALRKRRKTEGRRHDADDGERTLIQGDRGADDPRIRAERARHSALAQDHDRCGARRPSSASSTRPTSGCSPNSEKNSGVTTDVSTTDGLAVAGQRQLMMLRAGHAR